jgi:hypothetical protein
LTASTPTSEPGTEPAASHHDRRRSTFFLRDRAVGEVGADRDDGAVAADQQEQRRHQRAATDAGQPDEDADAEAEDDDQWVHCECSSWEDPALPSRANWQR